MKVRKIEIIEAEIPGLEKRIKQLRKSSPLTLIELAGLAGMTTANWHLIEWGKTKTLPLDTLRQIEKALGVDLGVKLDN